MQRARTLAVTPASIARAAAHLASGGLVAIPTETVYGLAAVAGDAGAVARLFAVKERPTFDPLIVHVAAAMARGPDGGGDVIEALAAIGLVDAGPVTPAMRDQARRLAEAFWPGPLTLVLPRGPAVPDLVTAGLATVGVRQPAHPAALALIERVGLPLAAPSANRFGRISPTTAADVIAELGDRIELVLDGGAARVGVESTVVALRPGGAPLLLRPGGAAREAIEAVVGPLAEPTAADGAGASPGMLASHYAPATRLRLLSGPVATVAAEAFGAGTGPIGVLLQQGDAVRAGAELARRLGRPALAVSLSASGDDVEAARNLFSALRALDASGAEVLFAEPVERMDGLRRAIADRLRRAAE